MKDAANEIADANKPISADEQAVINTIIRQSQIGNRLDPNNGFFPTMLSTAYYAVRKYDLALEALEKASRDNQWDEYSSDVVFGAWRTAKLSDGGFGAIWALNSEDSIFTEELSAIRAAARMAKWQAICAENAG